MLGLVGPNGAGKTTTIRMLLDILKPDSGTIELFGQPVNDDTKGRIGYLPEERGLYLNMKGWDILKYLVQLKGASWSIAQSRARDILTRAGLYEDRTKKISELSRGMSQIFQFVASIVHDPDLIVLDEPFAGLDPVNTELLKELVMELRSQGKTIIFSTHQMNQVEELCDRVLMVNLGRVVLNDTLPDIKRQFKHNSVNVTWSNVPPPLDGFRVMRSEGNTVELALDGTSTQLLLEQLLGLGAGIERFEVSTPSLNEIFISVVQRERPETHPGRNK